MLHFSTGNGTYSVQVIGGPARAYLTLQLGSERVDNPDISPRVVGEPYHDVEPERVIARVLEGTDAANREHGTSHHPQRIWYAVEDWPERRLLTVAARAIVSRLAVFGDAGYVGTP